MALDDLAPEESSKGRRKYVQPTREEFEECLNKTGHEWVINHNAPGKEIVYETHDFMPDHNGVVIRIFSTIDQASARARNKGSDAIRLVIWNNHIGRPMGGRKKTLRIETYCKNLRDKIRDIFESYLDYIEECPECGSWMVVREGQYGKFLGCTRYPDCRGTKEIEDD